MFVNLGCGEKKVDDSIGVDFRKTDVADVVHDLSVNPWHFEDEQFDGAYAFDIIEHMIWVIPFLDECWRILKPGAHLYIRTTNFEAEQSYCDPTHFHFFTLEPFDFFDPQTLIGYRYPWYSKYKWRIDKEKSGRSGEELVFDLEKLGEA